MKAQHRKELETNLLADRLGRVVQGVKSGAVPTTAIVWVLVGLVIVVGLGWYFTGGPSKGRSELWSRVEEASYNKNPSAALDELKAVAANNPGTMPGRTARFQRARLLLPLGLQSLYARQAKEREKAVADLEEARSLYERLIAECGGRDDALLKQEALLGAAQAEEALVGVPKEGDPASSRGDLDRALKWYAQLAKEAPDTFLGKQAAARAQQLEGNKADVQKFYTELNKYAAATK